jgi:hypothetical protein
MVDFSIPTYRVRFNSDLARLTSGHTLLDQLSWSGLLLALPFVNIQSLKPCHQTFARVPTDSTGEQGEHLAVKVRVKMQVASHPSCARPRPSNCPGPHALYTFYYSRGKCPSVHHTERGNHRLLAMK